MPVLFFLFIIAWGGGGAAWVWVWVKEGGGVEGFGYVSIKFIISLNKSLQYSYNLSSMAGYWQSIFSIPHFILY